MPRIRTVKPEFWGDEKLAPMAPIDRLVFLGLLSFADDAGRLLDNEKAIDGFVFPESSDGSRESLMRLAAIGRIVRYVSDSGQRLIQIANWKRHQRIEHASKYVLPAPPRTLSRSVSRDPHESLGKSSLSDLGPTTYDLRPTSSEQTANGAAPKGATPHEQRVLEHYSATHPKRRPGPKDLKAIRHALKLGYSAADLCEAITGNAADKWHAEKHKHELAYVLRDNGKIDDFRSIAARSTEPLVDDNGFLTSRGFEVAQ